MTLQLSLPTLNLVLLSRFKRCSGLKIYVSKSEMLWPGSMRNRKAGILNFQISKESVYALGTYFSYDGELSNKRNLNCQNCGKLSNFWLQRDISVYGRTNVVKSVALSKVIFICSSMETPSYFAEEVILCGIITCEN